MIRSRVAELTGNFDKDLLVIGDAMLDRFVWGSVERFSPEAAACPVLDFDRETKMLGGAGNIATNLLSLGASDVTLAGLVGRDDEGRELQRMMAYGGVGDFLLMGDRPTTAKTRFVADDKHLLRFDREFTEPASEHDSEILLERILARYEKFDGIVIQDYAKGAVTPFLVRELMKLAEADNTPVFVDPKSDLWPHFNGAALVKPNLPEAMSAFGVVGKEHEGLVERWGRSMLKYTRAGAVVVTRGKDGMSLFTKDEEAWAVPQPTKVVDVSGAGDTSMATLVLSRLAGATWVEAMSLANAAAGIAVGKRGTSTVTTDELLDKYPKE
jgi:rfaE bifunctional protein kinase chain/domain